MALPRHNHGRKRFARVVDLWLRQSSLTKPEFCKAAHLALRDNRLHPTQLSGLSHGTQLQISLYTFEAFGALSEAAYGLHSKNAHTLADQKLERLLRHVPPVLHNGNFATTNDFINLFLGNYYVEDFVLPEEWLGCDWRLETSLLKDSPELTDEAPEELAGSLGEGMRVILSALPGTLSDNLTKLLNLYPDQVSQDRKSKIALVAHNVPGANEFTPEEEESESLSLSIALTKLSGREISVESIRKAAQTSQALAAPSDQIFLKA